MRNLTPDTSPGKCARASPTTTTKDAMSPPCNSMPTPATTPTAVRTEMPQRRRRTIRTYGKKRQFSDDGEEDTQSLLVKRQRIEAPRGGQPPRGENTLSRQTAKTETSPEDDELDDDDTTVVQLPPPPPPPPPPEPASLKKRAGILRYFQPAASLRSPPSESSTCHSSPQSTAIITPPSSSPSKSHSSSLSSMQQSSPSSPPSSPPVPAARPRQKRRLTIRPDAVVATEKENVEPEAVGDGCATGLWLRLGLDPGNDALDKKGVDKSAKQADRPKGQPKNTVQTTLSLTIGGDAFKECKECNILYNPLHEKDAKFHARYHKSVRKRGGI